MNKQEYLSKLSEKLGFLDNEARDAALSFYAEMLEDRMESGMTEEESVAAMEDPDQLASRLKKEMPEEKKPSSFFIRPQETRKTFSADEIRHVRLKSVNTPIRVERGEEGQIGLSYLSTPEMEYFTTVENGVLTLDYVTKSLRFFVSFSFHSNAVVLKLPPDKHVVLEMETSNGKITLTGPLSPESVTAKTKNAAIQASDIRCRELTLVTSNGSLDLTDLETEDDLRASTSNGSVTALRIMAGRDLNLTASNGAVRAEALRGRDSLTLHTSNATIQVSRLYSSSITLATSNAIITGTLPGKMEDYAIKSGTSNGNNALPAAQPGKTPLSVHTSNAAIRIGFENE